MDNVSENVAVSKQARKHNYEIRVLTQKQWDDKQQCYVRRTLGFCVECSCGWIGERRNDWVEARWDAITHKKYALRLTDDSAA